jgi:hypothetical protein
MLIIITIIMPLAGPLFLTKDRLGGHSEGQLPLFSLVIISIFIITIITSNKVCCSLQQSIMTCIMTSSSSPTSFGRVWVGLVPLGSGRRGERFMKHSSSLSSSSVLYLHFKLPCAPLQVGGTDMKGTLAHKLCGTGDTVSFLHLVIISIFKVCEECQIVSGKKNPRDGDESLRGGQVFGGFW